MFYPSRQHVKGKHFKHKFTFSYDFMMNMELHFSRFSVIRNEIKLMRPKCRNEF